MQYIHLYLMISPRTVSAMKNMIVKYPLNVISLNPIDKKSSKTNYSKQ